MIVHQIIELLVPFMHQHIEQNTRKATIIGEYLAKKQESLVGGACEKQLYKWRQAVARNKPLRLLAGEAEVTTLALASVFGYINETDHHILNDVLRADTSLNETFGSVEALATMLCEQP